MHINYTCINHKLYRKQTLIMRAGVILLGSCELDLRTTKGHVTFYDKKRLHQIDVTLIKARASRQSSEMQVARTDSSGEKQTTGHHLPLPSGFGDRNARAASVTTTDTAASPSVFILSLPWHLLTHSLSAGHRKLPAASERCLWSPPGGT